jgi:uncharacterized paraquat-inducible protein A
MEPQNFTFVGFVMLLLGLALVALGGFVFGEVYFCTLNSANCPLSAADAAARIGYSIPLLLFGSLLITPGAIFTAAGHLSEHLRPAQVSEKESEDESAKPVLRVCVKCGRQVDPTASYCQNCGNQLSKS